MKTKNADKSKDNQQNKLIETTLKTSGFLFPKTVEEVKEYERVYGTTDIILPLELQESTFLYTESIEVQNLNLEILPSDNFAMAAREGVSNNLPEEIQRKIIEDIKKAEQKRLK